MTPAGVILPILLVPVLDSVNHMLPSGPCVIANGPALAVGSKYSTIVPLAGRVGMITLLEPHPVRASTIAAAANFRIVDTPLFIQSYTTKSLRIRAGQHSPRKGGYACLAAR